MIEFKPLFVGPSLRFTYLDVEKDPAVIGAWSVRPAVARALGKNRPLAAFEVKKKLEGWVKESAEAHLSFAFAVRPQGNDDLLGFARIDGIEWQHGDAGLTLVFAQPEQYALYGAEVLTLLLRFAFLEINLHRLSVRGAYETSRELIDLIERAGFQLEVRQKRAGFEHGAYCDRLFYGLLRQDWRAE